MQIVRATLSQFDQVQEFYTSVGYMQKIRADDLVVMARKTEKIVGVVRLDFDFGQVVLRGMMIAPDFQRCGIGSRMLKELEKHIGSQDSYCLPHDWLEGFYGQIGFEKIFESAAPVFLRQRLAAGLEKYPRLIAMKRPLKR